MILRKELSVKGLAASAAVLPRKTAATSFDAMFTSRRDSALFPRFSICARSLADSVSKTVALIANKYYFYLLF